MDLKGVHIEHFEKNGFFFIPNPLGEERMGQVERLQCQVEAAWEKREFPQGVNRLACQFLMVGEPLLQGVELPELVGMACRLLGCDAVQVGACGLGDASRIVAADGRPQRQVHWHADGGPDLRQVSLRTALDRHGPDNAPLRLLPGSHRRDRESVAEELRQLELATGQHDEEPAHCFAHHPAEVEVRLDPRWTLVWTPSAWHATGVKTASGKRRAMGWNYYPAGSRLRDAAAVRHVCAGQWEGWSAERRRLWGLD